LANAEYVKCMEDILDIYAKEFPEDEMLICMDESTKQHIQETKVPIPMKPGKPLKYDYEYKRNGVSSLFVFFSPDKSWRNVIVEDFKRTQEWVKHMKDLSDIHFPDMKKIHIVDDGIGMSKAGTEMAFKPHTTSKIKTEEDLLNIKTFGFRGEALASIASVSKVTLKTRQSGAKLGTEIIIEGGKVISINDTGAPLGTSILIEDLFYNVPARKEFMKSAQTEYKAVLDVIDAYAMAEPKVGLSFIHNEKSIYNLPPNDKLEERARVILGKDYYTKMIPVFFEHPHVEIYGFAAKPELASERKKKQYLFVNKRHINSKSISYAVKKAYGSLIPNNTYPPFIVFIDVEPNIVDVNVHPRKLEVKFSDEKFIFSSVQTAVKAALDRTDLTPGNEKQDMKAFFL